MVSSAASAATLATSAIIRVERHAGELFFLVRLPSPHTQHGIGVCLPPIPAAMTRADERGVCRIEWKASTHTAKQAAEDVWCRTNYLSVQNASAFRCAPISWEGGASHALRHA